MPGMVINLREPVWGLFDDSANGSDLVKISRRLITDDLPEDLYLHLR